ncbi:highly reducing polyketide synthase cm3B-like [Protopterus annectens]|uniref:highly reducing polyketide synthase cm3B-like n=1 Tax=Protopterus annectens TaxID=7888 RepID=UPI001CFBF2F0|nr:highly reducing polyketide synthase cm3B-like [Protopterus annectens]
MQGKLYMMVGNIIIHSIQIDEIEFMKFTLGEGLDNFWKVLVEGKNCTVEIPPERFNTKLWYDSDDQKAGKIRTSRAALIDKKVNMVFNAFDHKPFDISEAEAEHMDPQHKLLLECTYHALEDAGTPVENISGTKTGVFIGLMNRDYEMISISDGNSINHFNATGTATSIAANRISYCFNLTGPSLAIDTACSSSLVALHYACQAIKQGDCEMALCGGVSCIIEPCIYVALSKAKMISPDGLSKPFSKKADGYGRGEGCGILLLKPLKKAIEDHNRIWGIVLSSAINQDGRSVNPITRPSQTQQQELLKTIYSGFINSSHIQYIEAHGTGTAIGDPTEARSIGNILGKTRRPQLPSLVLGSVKGNIGHTESAAGVAGLIKVLLMMNYETIVPSLHYSTENDNINASSLNLRVSTSVERWEDLKFGRMAAVNSFGFGGTNAHVVVRQYEPMLVHKTRERSHELFVISAASKKSLETMMKKIAEWITKTSASITLTHLTYTSACRRSHRNHRYRKAFVVSSLNNLQFNLNSTSTSESVQGKKDLQLIFLFCGNGVTYKGMCKHLIKDEPIFRDKVKEIQHEMQKYTEFALLDILENGCDDYSKPDIAQPLIFAVQVAIVSLLKHWGIKPAAVIGHSLGEVAAAHCSGLIDLKDAVHVVYHRSTLQSKVTGGKMLVVGNVLVKDVSDMISSHDWDVSVAAFNSPLSCTVSGDARAVENFQQELSRCFSKQNPFLQILDTPAAYHSHMMDCILPQVKQNIGNLHPRKLESQLFSTVSGREASDNDFIMGTYWSKNVREPVAFEQAIKSAISGKKNIVFVEIGPKRVLQKNVVETVGKDTLVFPSCLPDKDKETILALVGQLFELGYNPKWHQLWVGHENVPAPYPMYYFDRTKQLVDDKLPKQGHSVVTDSHHPLIVSASKDYKEFVCVISHSKTPYIYEHMNNGVSIVPGTFHVELGIAAVMRSLKPKIPLRMCQVAVKFSRPCIVNQTSNELKITLDSQEGATTFSVASSAATYATGQVKQHNNYVTEECNIAVELIFKRCRTLITGDEIYDKLSKVGFQYGPVFRQLRNVFFGDELKEAITVIKVPGEIINELHEYHIHPIVMDYFLQMMAVVTSKMYTSRAGFPSGIDCLTMSQPLQKEMIMYMTATKITSDSIEICGCFADRNGCVLVELKDAQFMFLKSNHSAVDTLFFHNEWNEILQSAASGAPVMSHRILVFADNYGIASSLMKHLDKNALYVKHMDPEMVLKEGVKNLLLHAGILASVENCEDIVFMWGIEKHNDLDSHRLVQHLSSICEIYRQLVLLVAEMKSTCSIRTITYRTADRIVDHINVGFSLTGMIRSCTAEIPALMFQLIDLGSDSTVDIMALAQVLLTYKAQEYPEIMINQGKIYASEISNTKFNKEKSANYFNSVNSVNKGNFIIKTASAYKIVDLCAEAVTCETNELCEVYVEIEVDKICIHSGDYFPISISELQFGHSLYWNEHIVEKHKLLALDFSGTVTKVGSSVKGLKVGDHIACCYPEFASFRVTVPEAVCYNTNKLPCLRYTPSLSYFILGWEMLHKSLPKAHHGEILTIVSSTPDSTFCKVLTMMAKESGWLPSSITNSSVLHDNTVCSVAVILLPPFDDSVLDNIYSSDMVKHVILLCGNKTNIKFPQNLLKKNEVQIHILHAIHVLQKPYLKHIKQSIYKWLMSTGIGKSLSLPSNVFQQRNGIHGHMWSVNPVSYFNCNSVSMAVLKQNASEHSLSVIPVHTTEQSLFQSNAAYIVTGGLSGLGFETVKFIAQHGGGCIIILSRSSPTAEKLQEIANIESQYKGTRVASLKCDVGCQTDVEKAITLICKTFPKSPVKGVFHSAVVLHDGLLPTLNRSLFEKVFLPKVAGVMNLHNATKSFQLDYFVCFSSITSFIGNSAQTNYAAANSFLDIFCHYRRHCGLAAQSINWGALNVGLLLNKSNFQAFLESKGLDIMEITEIYDFLEASLVQNNPQQVACKFNFTKMYNHVLSQNVALRKRLYKVMREEINAKKFQLEKKHFCSAIKLEEYINSLLCKVSNVHPEDLNTNSPLSAFGIDSMLAMTLQNSIYEETHVNIPLIKILDPNATVSTLVELLKENNIADSQTEDSAVIKRSSENGIVQEAWS